jgi:hypothetical protein
MQTHLLLFINLSMLGGQLPNLIEMNPLLSALMGAMWHL